MQKEMPKESNTFVHFWMKLLFLQKKKGSGLEYFTTHPSFSLSELHFYRYL